MPLFTTLELGPTSQKGTPFWSHFGDLFSQKNEKRGFQKRPQNQSPKTLKMGPKLVFFYVFGLFFASKLCSDPLCCWNAPGPGFFTILASLFPHFCVAARYQEQLFFLPPPNWGGGQKAPILGGELLGSTFLLQLTRKHSLVGPLPPPKLGGGNFTLFVAVSACLFRQSTWRC